MQMAVLERISEELWDIQKSSHGLAMDSLPVNLVIGLSITQKSQVASKRASGKTVP